jgi:hypothetical protein
MMSSIQHCCWWRGWILGLRRICGIHRRLFHDWCNCFNHRRLWWWLLQLTSRCFPPWLRHHHCHRFSCGTPAAAAKDCSAAATSCAASAVTVSCTLVFPTTSWESASFAATTSKAVAPPAAAVAKDCLAAATSCAASAATVAFATTFATAEAPLRTSA